MQVGELADAPQRLERPRDGRHLLRKVLALEELVHDSVGLGLVAAPDLCEDVLVVVVQVVLHAMLVQAVLVQGDQELS